MMGDPDWLRHLKTGFVYGALGVVGAALRVIAAPPATRREWIAILISGSVLPTFAVPPTLAWFDPRPEWIGAIAVGWGAGAIGLVRWWVLFTQDPVAGWRALVALKPLPKDDKSGGEGC